MNQSILEKGLFARISFRLVFSIEILENGNWKKIRTNSSICDGLSQKKELKPGESFEFEWNQEHYFFRENKEIKEKVSPGSYRICLNFTSQKELKYKVCSKIFVIKELTLEECLQREWNKEECIKELAVREKNPNLCEKIIGIPYYITFEKDDCYFEVAIATRDSKICEKIGNKLYQNCCIKTIQRQPFTPEEVVLKFLFEYMYESIPLEKSNFVTKEYQQKVAEIIERGTLVDPVIFVQDVPPPEGVVIEKAKISNNTASVKAILKYSPESSGHILKIELFLIDGEWKINSIICVLP